jgi:restriction endonuclease Mrr
MDHFARAAIRSLQAIVVAISLLAMRSPAIAEDKLILGPPQFEEDKSGKGAVLCNWAIFLGVQAGVSACSLPRRPVDDAIDRAVTSIDAFIISNSSLHPTPAMVEEFKRRQRPTCTNANAQTIAQSIEPFRRASAEQIDAAVKELLSIPREPVMNPCL